MSTKNYLAKRPEIVWVMAATCAFAIANVYYNQPLLAVIGQSFHVSVQQVGFIPMLTQIGFATGLLLIIPLGDVMERRQLIVTLSAATACALAAAAISPNLLWLVVSSGVIGVTTNIPMLIVPFAAQLAGSKEQGKVVGIVMGGLLIGILLARTVSGFIAASLGWRAMYWIAAGLMIALAVVVAALLPKSQPSSKLSYYQLMRSLPGLIQRHPVLRESSIIGAMLFGGFSAFWATLVFLLEKPPYHYESDVAGLFGLVGIVGAMAAPVAGKLADKGSGRQTVGLAVVITMSSFLVFWLFGYHLWGLIVGVILLDLGVQAGHVTNQARIYTLPPETHSRLISIYMVSYFLGGALGSFLGAYGWSVWKWSGVCAVGLLMLIIAFAAYLGERKRQYPPQTGEKSRGPDDKFSGL